MMKCDFYFYVVEARTDAIFMCPGAQKRIRTVDLPLTKGVLYQLSYLGRKRELPKNEKSR